MEELLSELADEFGPGKIFRPYRDVRFSADKTPYKTNCAARVGAGYVSFSPSMTSRWAAACTCPTAASWIASGWVADEGSGAELVEIVADLHERGYPTVAHEILKAAPRAHRADHPRIELLRHKGIAVMKAWPVGAWLGTRTAKRHVVDTLRAAVPLNDWLARNVG